MQQQAIIHTEKITRKGELKYFQVPLPGTYKKIVAVETSVFILSGSSGTSGAMMMMASIGEDNVQVPEVDGGGGGGGGGEAPNNCPNPGMATIEPVSNNVSGSVRTQVFRIGAAVNPGFVYSCGVYSVVVSVTAVSGDTAASIAFKLAQAVQNTSLATWNQYGSNNQNYKPTGSSTGDLITLTTDNQHSFFASGSGSCGLQPPPPPPPPPPVQIPVYDPLFTITRNEKAGTLTLQSPDATDIFLQTEVFRDDSNIGFGDFTNSVLGVAEWTKGRKRYAMEVSVETNTPIIEVYYKDILGLHLNQNISYMLNLIVWIEKHKR